MKINITKKIIITLTLLPLIGYSGVLSESNFKVNISEIKTTISTNNVVQPGLFWLEWRRETNTTATSRTLTKFDYATVTNRFYLGDTATFTNIIAPPSYFYYEPKPEPIEGVDTYYVQSNLWSFIVYRNLTNSDILESIPVETITKKWKLNKEKVYEK